MSWWSVARTQRLGILALRILYQERNSTHTCTRFKSFGLHFYAAMRYVQTHRRILLFWYNILIIIIIISFLPWCHYTAFYMLLLSSLLSLFCVTSEEKKLAVRYIKEKRGNLQEFLKLSTGKTWTLGHIGEKQQQLQLSTTTMSYCASKTRA